MRTSRYLLPLAFGIAAPCIAAAKPVACQSYRPNPFSELYRMALVKGVEKGEYETTPQWRQRLARVFPRDLLIIGAAKIVSFGEEYDADKQKLTVKTGYSVSRSFGGGKSDYDTFKIGDRVWSEPGYIGQNAMGVTRRIDVVHYDTFALFWPHDLWWMLHDPNRGVAVDLHVNPGRAKGLHSHLSVVMGAIVTPPYVYANGYRRNPTFDLPEESHSFERGLVVTPRCAALVDDRTWTPLVILDPKTLVRR